MQPDEMQARLASIVATSDDAIVSKNLDGIVQSWNAAAEHIFGYTAEEMIGRPILTILPLERADEETDILAKIRAGDRVDHFETVRVRKDGRRIDVSVTISPLRDSTGKIIGASKIARDITEHKRLVKERERLYKLGTAMAMERDVHQVVQLITDAATELSGAEFGSFFYNVINEAGESYVLYTLSGASREQFANFPMPRNTAVFEPTFSGTAVVRSDDITLDPRYGKNPPYYGKPVGHLPVRSYLAVPVLGRSGEVLGGLFFGHADVGIFDEHSEQVVTSIAGPAGIALENIKLQQQLKETAHKSQELASAERVARSEAERVGALKDEFLATLSHELRTPLNAIMGWAQLLQRNPPTPEMLREGLEIVERNARIQNQLIGDLLDMSRIISGKVRLDVQRVDLAPIITSVVDSLRPSAEMRNLRINMVLDPVAGPVSGDPNRLQQVVWNLLNNAIKFTPKGGKIEVLLSRIDSHLEISVSDTGQGIKPEFLPHVFDRFRQADASTTREHGGLGLGLAISKQLVELHGGQIHAKSAGVGQGATFSVVLPLAIAQHAPESGKPSKVDLASLGFQEVSLNGKTILVVDDEADARDLLQRVLSERGGRVIVADSADKGLELVRSEKPDVILSDIGMPKKDGYEFILEVRKLPPQLGGKTPAIALTAFARSEDRTRAMMAGYQVHLAKPVEANELIATVASLIGRTGPQ
jgi:PAS domain S-box-containing protein